MSAPVLLDVQNLRIDIGAGTKKTRHNVVENVSFRIDEGETFGLVGESGCGKSLTALALIGLLRKPLAVTSGAIRFKGQDLRTLPARDMRKLRGNRIAMIFQEPMTALNPLSTVGRQIAEMFVLHQAMTWREAERQAVKALASVRIPAPEERVKNYPHQMSGGMRQRVMVAIALACRPDLLIADEPTTALDVTVQAEVLQLMRELCQSQGTAVLMISHDLGVIAHMCRRIGVMYAGHLVEARAAIELFQRPAHPYTHGLLASLPQLGSRHREGQRRLQEIAGVVPAISAFPDGCRFAPRCTRASEVCQHASPEKIALASASAPGNSPSDFVRCFHHV